MTWRVFILLIFALFFMRQEGLSQGVSAQEPLAIGGEFCAHFGSRGQPAHQMEENRDIFKCEDDKLAQQGDYLWLLADLSNAAFNIESPVLRATMSRHGGIQTYATYADGTEELKTYPIGFLRNQWRSPNRMSFPLESKSGSKLQTLLIGVDDPWDTANWDELELLSTTLDNKQHIRGMAYSSLYIGLLLGPLIVSICFFVILRARFIIIHFGMIFAAFLYGVSWSGLTFALFPALDVSTRSNFNHVAIPIGVMFGCLFARELCELDKLPRFWRSILVYAGVLPVLATTLALFVGHYAPQASYVGIGYALTLSVVTVVTSLCIAAFNGSLMAKLQLVGWSGVGVIIIGNMAHDLGLTKDHWILDQGLFPTLLLEALITTSLVTYRVVKLRRESDRATSEHVYLERAATTDYLTGLSNRAHFIRHFEMTVATRTPEVECTALICLDIDHFKKVNDNHGHMVGDRTLVSLASILKESCQERGLCARFGGEEFSLLLSGASKQDLYYQAERLRHRIAEHDFTKVGQVTVSIGLVHLDQKIVASFDRYYEAADRALYAAKTAGRNQVQLSGWKPDFPKIATADQDYAAQWSP